MEGHRNVLIAVNGSLAALHEGLRIAEQGNCWATVLKVLPAYEGEIDLTGVSSAKDVIASGRADESRRLEAAVRGEPAARVRVEQGELPETICRVAAEEGSDVIILAVKKDAGWIRSRLDGRLIRKVTSRAPCPVLVARS